MSTIPSTDDNVLTLLAILGEYADIKVSERPFLIKDGVKIIL